ncbi:hypothetical protein RB595_007865 [Gaeumannomyces hyphopodioides]
MPVERDRRGGGAHDPPGLHVRPPAHEPEPVGQKEVISTPASLHQKESFKDYDSLPQAVFPTGFKTGVGKRGRAPGPEATDNEDAHSPSHSSPQRRSYYPDEAFVISPIVTRSDDFRRRNESATECATNASYSPSSGPNATKALVGKNERHSAGETNVGDEVKEGIGGFHAITSQIPDGAEDQRRGTKEKKPAGKICGLRRKWFFVVVPTITALLVGIIVAVVVATTGKRHYEEFIRLLPAPPPPNGTSRGGLHQGARLTAASWVGNDNKTHRAVISQDKNGTLFASYFETGGKWTPVQVSSLLKPLESATGGLKPADLVPAAGTPLAAAVSSTSGLNVFFKTQKNNVVSIRTPVNSRTAWDWTEQSREMSNQPGMTNNIAAGGSDIAAATRRVCSGPASSDSCFNDVLATYLSSDNKPSGDNAVLRLFNETHWRTYSREPLARITDSQWKSAYPDQPNALAMTHFPQDIIPGSLVGSMRVIFAEFDGVPQQMVSNATTIASTWVLDTAIDERRTDRGPLGPGKLAVSTFDGDTQMLMVTATSDGKFLAARHWSRGSHFWADQRRITIFGRPADLPSELNITALAMTDGHLYINNNSTNIEEYESAAGDPYSIRYKGTVDIFPPED